MFLNLQVCCSLYLSYFVICIQFFCGFKTKFHLVFLLNNLCRHNKCVNCEVQDKAQLCSVNEHLSVKLNFCI